MKTWEIINTHTHNGFIFNDLSHIIGNAEYLSFVKLSVSSFSKLGASGFMLPKDSFCSSFKD